MNANPSSYRAVAAWCGLALYPVALGLALAGSAQTVPLVRALGVALSAVLVVGVARRVPMLALVVVLLGTVGAVAVQPHYSPWGPWHEAEQMTLPAFVSADALLGCLVARRSRRQWTTGVALSVVVQSLAIAAWTGRGTQIGSVVVALLAVVVACMVGLLARERREHADALRVRAVAEAVTAERLRIARELHDMVSHSISVIAIQSGVASRVIESQPAEARAALGTIEETSRETLRSLRRTLVALRRAEPGEAAPLTPTAGLADLERLVASTADAGVRVEVVRTGEEHPLPSEIDRSAYRVVQESLTNVVRHGRTDTARVLVSYADDAVSLEIVDAGRGAATGSPGTGFGITGMRERVSLLHGDFDAGPRPDGGFRVTARIPLPEAGAAAR
ncbi:sensor histidine kinase [Streptomyces beihaiensis]|uniref:histidine kinase n=1 Tax=Streptomyces beihaiensis TaxID=2984495 RepID=A0ABT3U4D9_9ACTN|nr:histidine kinase [Streptomyces beihaiensis]MCX3064173.1 sensor histidine kinase [Streptomyces beihaiensis]